MLVVETTIRIEHKETRICRSDHQRHGKHICINISIINEYACSSSSVQGRAFIKVIGISGRSRCIVRTCNGNIDVLGGCIRSGECQRIDDSGTGGEILHGCLVQCIGPCASDKVKRAVTACDRSIDEEGAVIHVHVRYGNSSPCRHG